DGGGSRASRRSGTRAPRGGRPRRAVRPGRGGARAHALALGSSRTFRFRGWTLAAAFRGRTRGDALRQGSGRGSPENGRAPPRLRERGGDFSPESESLR